MRTYILQDMITVRGSNTTVTQTEADWLDLEPFQDVVIWLELREVTPAPGAGTVTLNVQTSPTKDESFFAAANLVSVNLALTGTTMGVQTPTKVIMSTTAGTPLARYLRWQLTSTSTPFDATFRLVVSANVPGN
jgi:hypothetical protein